VAERIEALPEVTPEWRIEAREATVGEYKGMLITVNGQPVLGLLPGDLDPESGETLQEVSDRAVTQLRIVLEARAQQRSLPLLLRAVALSVAATALFLVLVGLVIRSRRLVLARLEKAAEAHLRGLSLRGVDIRPQVLAVEKGAVKLSAWAVGLILAYFWLTFVLIQFPYSQPWGEHLGSYLVNLSQTLGTGVLQAIPGIFTVLVIFLLTRAVARLVREFFERVEEGKLTVPWLQPESARATRRLVLALIWIFALIVAYPYIPGSNTDAFKGVSVFVGLMVSLGSAGLVNQVMSGLVVVYSRALKPGDYVRIGDNEGLVSEVGVLSTKLVTPKREEITIPNAVLVGTKAINYSRLAGETGAIVGTSVTIGYDVPWRQVQALLLLAAERTEGVRKEPRPVVLQRALADFFVEYQLLVSVDRPERRYGVLSDLHANIQDAFNEFGVQILSPHFVSQPDNRVYVPRAEWFAAPASDPRQRADGSPRGAGESTANV
jgi:small-conductance mechanosensitive channel